MVDRILADGKRLALPVCFDNGRMTFRYITDKSQLVKGKFSAPEPNETCEEYVGNTPTVCVIPAIAFDKAGYRLGYGKGYYDRFLSLYNCKAIGIAFDECVCDELPHGMHDYKIDCLITDKEEYYF